MAALRMYLHSSPSAWGKKAKSRSAYSFGLQQTEQYGINVPETRQVVDASSRARYLAHRHRPSILNTELDWRIGHVFLTAVAISGNFSK